MFTIGEEFTTAITNIFIMLISLYSFIKLRKENISTYWKRFFFLLTIDGLLGFIIHGINLNQNIIDILWLFLLIGFSLTINNLLFFYLEKVIKVTKKHFIILTILIYLILFLEAIFKVEFLFTFMAYCIISLLIVIFINLKYKKNIYILIGIILQFIGGAFIFDQNFLIKIIFYFDQNGIYHFFMMISCILFYLGCKKEKELL